MAFLAAIFPVDFLPCKACVRINLTPAARSRDLIWLTLPRFCSLLSSLRKRPLIILHEAQKRWPDLHSSLSLSPILERSLLLRPYVALPRLSVCSLALILTHSTIASFSPLLSSVSFSFPFLCSLLPFICITTTLFLRPHFASRPERRTSASQARPLT